jgi:adenylate cyclase class 1
LDHEIEINFKAQFANNQARIRELRRYATAGFARVFDLAPGLLQVNAPGLPGFVDDAATPHGLRQGRNPVWPTPDTACGRGAEDETRLPAVESLILIGSSGSIGHTVSSDLDYWVCYDPRRFNAHELSLFSQKLAAVSLWAQKEHDTEANFYLVNLDELLQGRILRLGDDETEGEAAPHLLLEELYRTMLYVAGRLPVWLGLPLSADAESYRRLAGRLTAKEDSEYVDLGFPVMPSPQEFLAAALWLARKSEADPFKGILKIVALLEYVESDFAGPLLCNEVKRAIFSARPEELPVDPYTLTVNRVTEYGAASLTPDQLNLLRTAAAIKIMGSGGSRPVFALPKNSPKKKMLDSWAERWGWSQERLAHLNNYSLWPERERLNIGGELLNMLMSVYTRIAHRLIIKYPGQVNPQDAELVPLAARILARQGGLDATVEPLPSYLHRKSIVGDMFLVRDSAQTRWNLYAVAGGREPPAGEACEDNLIYSAARAARVAAWLVNNQLYSPSLNLCIRAGDDDDSLTWRAFMDFLNILQREFPPPDFRARNDALWSVGGCGRTVLVPNFELPAAHEELSTADFICRTGWGEMRHHYIDLEDLKTMADKYLKIARRVSKESESAVEDLVFHIPGTPAMKKIIMNIKGALAAMKRGRIIETSYKSRLDL